MACPVQRSKSGLALIEVMLAGSILALSVLSLFEGVAVCARIVHENAEFLVADAYAHDLAWKRTQESYSNLSGLLVARNGGTIQETISSNAAPKIWRADAPPVSYTTLSWPRNADGVVEKTGVVIDVDVEWGAPGKRHRLSASSNAARSFKSGIGQEDAK